MSLRIRCINDDGSTFSVRIDPPILDIVEILARKGERRRYVKVQGQPSDAPVLWYVLYETLARGAEDLENRPVMLGLRLEEEPTDTKPLRILPTLVAKVLGQRGGLARWKKLTKAERSAIGKRAIQARWARRAT